METLKEILRRIGDVVRGAARAVAESLVAVRVLLLFVAMLAAAGYALYRHPPFKSIARGELGIRANHLTGDVSEWREGTVLVLPGLQSLRIFSLREQVYRPVESARADGRSPFQSVEGLSLGVDVSVRYALEPARLRAVWNNLPDDVSGDIVQPAVASIVYKVFARYTVREIFSSKRSEIQEAIEAELREKLAPDGIALRDVLIGNVDLPPDYRRGTEALLAEELASERMRYTLELKEKQVKQTELEAEAARVRREKAAEAAAREQVIAARGQEEAMKHVLPYKERQIESHKLEAEADRVAAIRRAKGLA